MTLASDATANEAEADEALLVLGARTKVLPNVAQIKQLVVSAVVIFL